MQEYDLDPEVRAYIKKIESFYPDSSTVPDMATRRALYDDLNRAFHHPRPDGISATDSAVEGHHGPIGIRTYQPGNLSPNATVIYLHGGGFVFGNLDSHDGICAEICAATAYTVVAVDYHLAPEFTHPVQFEDALDVFKAVYRRPLILCGDSSGANLAAAVCVHQRGSDRPASAQVLIYPALGGELLQLRSYDEHADAPLLTTDELEFYRAARTRGEVPVNDPSYYPLALDDYARLPPCEVFSADNDPLRDDSKIYAQRLNDAGVAATWHNEKGLIHGYLRARHTSAKARSSFNRICAAITRFGAAQ